MLKLPKCLEPESRIAEISSALDLDKRPLWGNGSIAVSHIAFNDALGRSLAFVRRCGKLRGGFENIETLLQREEAGLVALNKRGITSQSGRVSRLILMSNDGSDRFNRACEALLIRHKDRLLGLRMDVNSSVLGAKFFGSNAAVKIIMVEKRECVSKVLLSLIEAEPTKGF